ncbi:hypothetical protein NG99_13330 [Erwinia typographi]|uniref:Uncharacterized protein n=1 Tax=Erwinia typographi TaxID=371042 RepID=A0A0A4A4V3_9GAMM|nr:hypothetical protein NG99_13330 [Erwinia typographi]
MATLARRFARMAIFIALFCLGARIIDPSTFISLELTEAYAQWQDGYVSQENFEDLWVIAWLLSSLIFAIIGDVLIIRIARRVRR